MNPTFFLVYLGGLLVSSVAMFAFVKQMSSGFADKGKSPLVYGSLSSVLTAGAAFATTFISDNLFLVFIALTVIFILLGSLYMKIVHNKKFSGDSPERSKVLLAEFVFGLSVVFFTILIFSSIQYFLKDKSYLFYPMMLSTLGFFIPMLFMHTFDAAVSIPSPVYKAWNFPAEPLHLPEDDPREKLLVIGFEIAKKSTDNKKTYFRAKAPENIYLGDLYYFFLADYNELQSETPIEFADANEQTQQWIFKLKRKWFQSDVVLDPYKTIKENRILENSVIICDRI